MVQRWAPLFESIGATQFVAGGPEADISPLVEQGVPGFGLSVEGSKYFWYHHTAADTIDKVNPKELSQCVGTMALMAYLLADAPERLPAGIASKSGAH
jgi:carboxypeptidase Q